MIGVGILGANPDRGWASRAHVPAIHASPDLTLAAVATTRTESAEAARGRFGARHAFTDTRSLVGHPDVDLVVVAVKVSTHVDLVTAALEAGKHVYCEWPLTMTATEAEALAGAAERAGVHAMVGLQARFAPAVEKARELIADGRIGTILTATFHGARNKGNTAAVPAWTAYTYDQDQAAGLVEILGGHALDAMQYMVGPIADISARTAIGRPVHHVLETGAPVLVTAPDAVVATALLAGGGLVSIHMHDGEAGHGRTRIEIAGTEGSLLIVMPPEKNEMAAQLQIGRLDLFEAPAGASDWSPVPLDHDETLPVEAANIARAYGRLAEDIRTGTHSEPGFRTAHDLHVLIERMMRTTG